MWSDAAGAAREPPIASEGRRSCFLFGGYVYARCLWCADEMLHSSSSSITSIPKRRSSLPRTPSPNPWSIIEVVVVDERLDPPQTPKFVDWVGPPPILEKPTAGAFLQTSIGVEWWLPCHRELCVLSKSKRRTKKAGTSWQRKPDGKRPPALAADQTRSAALASPGPHSGRNPIPRDSHREAHSGFPLSSTQHAQRRKKVSGRHAPPSGTHQTHTQHLTPPTRIDKTQNPGELGKYP
ncbi:uncharacterized protein B0H64DRAFT_176109 [Chaetomium fimeti]|uniref:Uncharacterized protein n=1 Tax=Chaetomium fimeti TaxID=1854472 RepID=A0AAE0HCE4_9PEZI|nr:hypothetical protein B0H64DRAFT_176109 [Chaetomium fimeti]